MAHARRVRMAERDLQPPHRWRFIRSGGVDQVVIRNGGDVVHLESLDQTLWVALACPTRGLDFDARTLDLIDADGDGRIRPPELIAATRWVRARFRDPDELLQGGDGLQRSDIAVETPEGRALDQALTETLALLGKPEAPALVLDDVERLYDALRSRRTNGDGVILASQLPDGPARDWMERIGAAYGTVADRSGESGIDRARIDCFVADVVRLRAWHDDAAGADARRLLGDDAADALDVIARLAEKVDDFFTRCELAHYDPLAASMLDAPEATYRTLSGMSLHRDDEAIARMPLAVLRGDGLLPLRIGVNPAWRDELDALRRLVIEPLYGADVDAIDVEYWSEVRDRLASSMAWLHRRPDTPLHDVSSSTIVRLDIHALREEFDAAIEADVAAARQNERLREVEKFMRFRRDLVHLLNNFVSFSEFYAGRPAIFEAGTLYLDGRSCDLTVAVADVNKHPALAGLAKACLAYCECRRGQATRTIVAVFTAGDVDYLLVGRNGVFYDRKGDDWDATIVKMVDNPISIRQAFFSPYRKLSRMIEEQVARRAAARESGVEGRLGSFAVAAVQGSARPGTTPADAAGRRIDIGTVAALGVALGSISTVVVAVFAKFVDLGWWIPVAVLGIMLAISGPSVIIAWLKLRQRSLGPILDASGWAINGRMKINIPLGAVLSRQARLPKGAELRLRDPFAERHGGAWSLAMFLVLVLGMACVWLGGVLDGLLPAQLRASSITLPWRSNP